MVEVDAYIGEIVDALDRAGVLENTFIFVTSDNGPQRDSWPDTGYTPFRGAQGVDLGRRRARARHRVLEGDDQAGRQSDELFDLMDLFNTSLALAGRADKIPTDRYIDGIDQTSFLLADDGHSRREKVYIWAESRPHGDAHVRVQDPHQGRRRRTPQWLDIDMTTKADVGLAPWLFNLYIDPKEEYPVGHRMNAWLASMAAELKGHGATFKKYPPRTSDWASSAVALPVREDCFAEATCPMRRVAVGRQAPFRRLEKSITPANFGGVDMGACVSVLMITRLGAARVLDQEGPLVHAH